MTDNIVKGAKQDVEWNFLLGGIDRICLNSHADASDADSGSIWNLQHRAQG